MDKRIKDYRVKYKLTQVQLAKLFSCQQSQISKWERGITKPSKLRMVSIMEKLGVNRLG